MNIMSPQTSQQIKLTKNLIETRKEYLGLTALDEAEIMQFHGAVTAMSESVVEQFYANLQQVKEYRDIVTDQRLQNRMRLSMVDYLDDLFSGCYDVAYAKKRFQLGKIHYRLGISASLLMASLFHLEQLVHVRLMDTGLLENIPASLAKVFVFDSQLIADAYTNHLIITA